MRFTLALLIAAAAGPCIAIAEPPADIRVVDAEAHVQSRKRGVAANHLHQADFEALAPGVSWWYNWHHTPGQTPPPGVAFEFVPMVWGNHPDSLAGLEAYLAGGNRPRQILAVNEPNLRGQAFITPQQTAAVYESVKAVAAPYGIPVSGPQMALGSAPGDSITAFDPLQNQQVTYTYMVPFVDAFLHYAGDTPVSSIGYHVYGNIGEFRWALGEARTHFNRPLWVTEFAWWDAPNVDAARTYLIQAVDLLERSPDVEGYAWFKERTNREVISLFSQQPGALSALGEAYVTMPVHDTDLYYRPNGRLQAEKYVTLHNAEIAPTADGDGFADMFAAGNGAWLDYNIFVEDAGVYDLALRLGGIPGDVQVVLGDEVLAVLSSQGTNWKTLSTQIDLAAGAQTLRIRLASTGQSINWLEFTPIHVPEPGSVGLLSLGCLALVARRHGVRPKIDRRRLIP